MAKYYLAIKRNEVLIQAIIWMSPKNIMLSEASVGQKTIRCDSIYMQDKTYMSGSQGVRVGRNKK